MTFTKPWEGVQTVASLPRNAGLHLAAHAASEVDVRVRSLCGAACRTLESPGRYEADGCDFCAELAVAAGSPMARTSPNGWINLRRFVARQQLLGNAESQTA